MRLGDQCLDNGRCRSRFRSPFVVVAGCLGLLLLVLALHSSADPVLVIYGGEALPKEGDDDHLQVIYFSVPVEVTEPLYLHVFDPDSVAQNDLIYGTPDTQTRFSLYGGAGATTGPTARQAHPSPEALAAGERLLQRDFGADSTFNDRWHLVGAFAPAKGELSEGRRFFKLVVEGLSGDDGNLYDVAISVERRRQIPPDGLHVFTYSPSVRVANPSSVVEMQLDVPSEADTVKVHNFDAASGQLSLETEVRSRPVVASRQGEWRRGDISLEANEKGKRAVLAFSGGDESPNDATFYVTDQHDTELPIRLPILSARSNQRPTATAQVSLLSDCLSVAFDASASSDPDGDGLRFVWDFGDGTKAEGEVQVHRYPQAGAYQVSVTATDDSGQPGGSVIKTLEVVIPQLPTAEPGPDRVVALGDRLTFDGSASTPGDGTIVAYAWSFGDGKEAVGKLVSHAFTQTGQFTVTLQVRNDVKGRCNTAHNEVQVRVNASPVAEAGENRVASVGEVIQLDGGRSYDPDGTIQSYLWKLGDGTEQTTQAIEYAYDQPGRYQVTLTVQDDAGVANSGGEDTLTVIVNEPPVAMAGPDRNAAIGEDIEFDGRTSTDADGDIVEYRWTFGDGTQATGSRVIYAYPQPGRYQVTLTVRDNSGSRSSTHSDALTVVVNEPPVAKAGPDQVVSASEIQFDGRPSTDPDGRIVSYLWEFGDGTTSSEAAPVHVYRKPGVYTARLTVSDDSGTIRSTTSDTLKVVVNAAPIADAGPDQIGTPGQLLTFDGSGSIDPDGRHQKLFWDFGDGQSATGVRVTHDYAKPGTYTVLLKVEDATEHAAAVDYDEAKVMINAAPVAKAGRDRLVAPGDRVTLSGAHSFDTDGNIVSYRWQFSDVDDVVNKMETRRTYTSPGVATARVTVIDDSGASNDSAQDDVTIRINHPPQAVPGRDIRTQDNTISLDASASTDPDGHVLTYSWDMGDGSPPKLGSRVSHTYAVGGTYPVVLTVDDGTGLSNAQDSAALTVVIDRAPVAMAGGHQTACTKDVVVFDGSASIDPEGGPLRYEWDLGDGTRAEGVNPTHIYQEKGIYRVTLSVQDESGLPGNRHTDRIRVKVHDSPVAIAGPDQTVCTHTQVVFDGSASRDADGIVNRFSWNFGDHGRGEGERVTHAYANPGTYRVTLGITGDQVGECDDSDSDTLTVTVVEAPVAAFTGPDVVAQDVPVTFDASASTSSQAAIVSWQWDFGDGTSGAGETVTHTYATPGQYPVTLTIATEGNVGTCSVAMTRKPITVNAAPQAVAGADRFVGIYQEVLFDASASHDTDGGIVSYGWDFGDGTTATGMQVRHRYRTSGTFDVKLTVKDDTSLANNTATDQLVVTVNSTPQPVLEHPAQACVGENVQFSGQQSHDENGEIATYEWNFGDGETGRGSTANHAYAAPGRYQVTLKVNDGMSVNNSTNEASQIITVNQPPQADAGPPRVVCHDSDVRFDATASVDLDGKLMRYAWDFGHGETDEGETVTHRFTEPGVYQVKLVVTDDSGSQCSTSTAHVQVRVNALPVAVAGPDRTVWIGGAYDATLFDAGESRDADQEPLTYQWVFGDGVIETGAKVLHTYARPGRYNVRLRVRDSSGLGCGEAWDEVIVEAKERP